MQVGIIVETAEAREINHFALLLGYGASIINPYLAFGAIDYMVKEGKIEMEYKEARKNYIKAIDKGLLKIFSKMGISTLRSYHGAQIFESLGISKEIINQYFTGTVSKINGIGLDEMYKEVLMVHEQAFKKVATPESFRFDNTGSLCVEEKRRTSCMES